MKHQLKQLLSALHVDLDKPSINWVKGWPPKEKGVWFVGYWSNREVAVCMQYFTVGDMFVDQQTRWIQAKPDFHLRLELPQ